MNVTSLPSYLHVSRVVFPCYPAPVYYVARISIHRDLVMKTFLDHWMSCIGELKYADRISEIFTGPLVG